MITKVLFGMFGLDCERTLKIFCFMNYETRTSLAVFFELTSTYVQLEITSNNKFGRKNLFKNFAHSTLMSIVYNLEIKE